MTGNFSCTSSFKAGRLASDQPSKSVIPNCPESFLQIFVAPVVSRSKPPKAPTMCFQAYLLCLSVIPATPQIVADRCIASSFPELRRYYSIMVISEVLERLRNIYCEGLRCGERSGCSSTRSCERCGSYRKERRRYATNEGGM